MKTERIPFDIKYRSDIEAGRYRVETRDGRPARIVCWDAHNRFFIIVLVSDEYDFENIYKYVENGRFYGQTTDEDTDLFLVPVEQEKQTHPVRKHNSSPAVKEILDSITDEDVQKAKEEMEKEIEQEAYTTTCWIARDKDGGLWAFEEKPERFGTYWERMPCSEFVSLPSDAFPSLRWRNKPIEVTLTIKLMEESK